MRIRMLQAKLHRVRVTHADLHYEGSCALDQVLLDRSGIRHFQHLEIYNVHNGARFTTYALPAPPATGQVSLNGAAARLAMLGDPLIICAYADYDSTELARHKPIVVLVDHHNHPQT